MSPTRVTLLAGSLLAAAMLALSILTNPGQGPDPAALRDAYRASDALLLDRHGRALHELRVDSERRRLQWTPIERISPALISAVIEAEDRRFYDHRGVDWHALVASLAALVSSGEVRRGASTISMQLAAHLDATLAPVGGRRSVVQKITQMRAARRLERAFDKPRILESYLNLISFRGEVQGIAAAARGIFDKSPAGLTRDESVILAALIRAPNATPQRVAGRACELLGRLSGSAGEDCGAVATRVGQGLDGAAQLRQRVALAPHVARMLLKSGNEREVPSTLDADMQRFALAALQRHLHQLRGRAVGDGAVLVVDNHAAEVRAYVGNTGTDSSTFYVDGVQAPRQAGSTLKPFLYGSAIERRRLTAASLLLDSPLNLTTPTGAYVPQNYDRVFRGWVSARTALAGSVNIPAVRTLMLVGVDAFAESLRQAGYRAVDEDGDYYGYSLALGSAEVTLWQQVTAYRALADGGRLAPLTLVPRTEPPPVRRILGETAAFIVTDILADRAARAVTFGLDSALSLPFPASVKTGTSKDMRDNWCIGYTDRYTVGVWVGNFDGAPMQDVSGVSGAAPVWADIMRFLHRDRPAVESSAPASIERRMVRFEPPLEASRQEWFVSGTATTRMTPVPLPERAPRIAYPGDGMTLALDPDIPPGRQRVLFRMVPSREDMGWRLDDTLLEGADASWSPAPGFHRLDLVDAHGAIVDQVRFSVRGDASVD